MNPEPIDEEGAAYSWDSPPPRSNLRHQMDGSSAAACVRDEGHNRHGSVSFPPFDLNSQAVDPNTHGYFTGLLNSPLAAVFGDNAVHGRGSTGEDWVDSLDGNTFAPGSGRARGTGGRGRAGTEAERGGRGRGYSIARGRGGSRGGRGGRSSAATGVRSRGNGRGTGTGRPPMPPSSLPYRAPRATGSAAVHAQNSSASAGFQESDESNWSDHQFEENLDAINGNDASNEDGNFDKAEWTNSENNTTFCTLCVDEINAGNRSNGFMTTRAYKNMAIRFEEIGGLRHSKVQLKNRWEGLKRMYSFWLWCNKHTGLGRTPTGGIQANEQFWKTYTKGKAEWRKLKNGPPENLSELEIMFEHTAVDGSTSCTPGQDMDQEDAVEDVEGDADGSPMSTNSMKRGNASTTSVSSPRKRIKSPMVRMMKGIWDEMKETNVVAQKAMKGEYVVEQVKECMRLVVASGSPPGSEAHFIAGKLFQKAEQQGVFLSIEDNEGRQAWLRRCCQANN